MHSTHYLNILLAFTISLITANPTPNPGLTKILNPVLLADDVTSFKKRDCDYNGCACDSRGKQLTVCGNCRWGKDGPYAVTKKRVENHIFECSPTGNCCDYGYATDCGTPKARCIVN